MSGGPQSDYFATFPKFRENRLVHLSKEFDRLASSQGWQKHGNRYRREKRKCILAQYEAHIGSVESGGQLEKLAKFRVLCEELGISPAPESITQCKHALKGVHVNIIDLIDSRRRGTRVRVFRSYQALQEYTKAQKEFFPIEKAKRDGILKVLLRGLN